MRRDWDVVRALLLGISAGDRSPVDGMRWDIALDNNIRRDLSISSEVLNYHKRLILDANLVYGNYESYVGHSVMFNMGELTWEGQDFLDNIQDSKVWDLVKEKLSKVSGTASLEVLKGLAKESIKAIMS